MVQESTGNCLGSDVRDRDGLRPAGEPVDTYRQVSLSVAGWLWADDVQVDMIKARIWSGKCSQCCQSMALYLRALASYTFTCPASNVPIYAWPDKFYLHQSLGGSNPGMRQSVQELEHMATEGRGQERASSADACVTANLVLECENGHPLKIQGSGRGQQVLPFFIFTLSGCQSGKINL
ncbi:hypothetical protein MRX96_052051 [Rhipicephalus microplus]